MPTRVSDFEKKVLFTKTNPENIISGKKGSWFFRRGSNFYLNISGDLNDHWEKLPYKTVILPAPDPDKVIKFETFCELWFKSIDGRFDEFGKLLPKTGWTFFSNKDVFTDAVIVESNWTRVPVSSLDPVGTNKSRSYDENFFYVKIDTTWYRTPIAIFTTSEADLGENPSLYTNLPYVQAPRYLPVPASSTANPTANGGTETYDSVFYYIKPSKWKRCPLIIFDPSKLAIFDTYY